MACITNRQVGYMYYNDLLLMQVDSTTATDLGTYVTGTFIGQPKLVDYGGPCLLYRSGNSAITALKWNGTAFEKFSDDTVKGNFLRCDQQRRQAVPVFGRLHPANRHL